MKRKALFSAVCLAFSFVANDQFANDDANLKKRGSAKRAGRCD